MINKEFENLLDYPTDYIDEEEFHMLMKQFINILSEKGLTISQTRYLFYSILEYFERGMPVKAMT